VKEEYLDEYHVIQQSVHRLKTGSDQKLLHFAHKDNFRHCYYFSLLYYFVLQKKGDLSDMFPFFSTKVNERKEIASSVLTSSQSSSHESTGTTATSNVRLKKRAKNDHNSKIAQAFKFGWETIAKVAKNYSSRDEGTDYSSAVNQYDLHNMSSSKGAHCAKKHVVNLMSQTMSLPAQVCINVLRRVTNE
jgi:hypothetical protein